MTPFFDRQPPSIAELTRNYIDGRSAAPVEFDQEDVTPYEVSSGFRTEPRVAWEDALAALKLMSPVTPGDAPKMPQAWAGLVNGSEPMFAVPICVGNFPQLVNDLSPLMRGDDLGSLRPDGTVQPSGLRPGPAAPLLQAGLRRLEGDFDTARDLLDALEESDLTANERAAVEWHAGRWDAAERIWAGLSSSPVAEFNRGVAALFGGRPAEAAGHFREAVSGLPQSGGWHHLAGLYLALAEIRS